MTIARFAQDKFEYQDLATLNFALAALEVASLEVRPEPQIGEDTEVVTRIDGHNLILDVQAKDEAGGVDLDRIAKQLAHPTAHRTDETLLDRLLADPNRIAVFVTSARCRDDAALFAAPEDWSGRTMFTPDPTQVLARDLMARFGAVDLSSTRYEIARKAHRQVLAGSMDGRRGQAVLRRVVIVERVTRAALRQRCIRQVAAAIRAPDAAAEPILNELLDLVRTAKAQGDDLVPELRRILAVHRRRPFGAPDYEPRGAEPAWVQALQRDSVLLLGGPPRCGKTDAAEHVAYRFQDLGYEVVRADDLADARRYLHEDGPSPRLVLLDDPLGDGWSISDVPGAYETLRRLIPRTGPRRALLVAQNQTPLLNAAAAGTLADVRTSGRAWVDLAPLEPAFAARVWRRKAASANVPPAAVERLDSALAAGRVRLDLGALQHLAYAGRVQGTSTVADMVAIADEEATTFGQRLAAGDPVMERVVAAFGLATDPATGLDDTTLAFIVDGPSASAPSLMVSFVRIYSFTGPKTESPVPTYTSAPILSIEAQARVEALENRRVLVRDADGRLQFAHGFYRAAALGLLRQPAAATAQRHLAMAHRSLFCLDPRVSRATAKNLDRTAAALPADQRSKAIDLAASGLRSMFPGTRDLCWRFLIARLDSLPTKARRNLPQWLQLAYATDLDDIVWRGGEAWIRTGDAGMMSERLFRRVALSSVRTDLQGIEGQADYSVSPERADRLLGYYAGKPNRMNRTAAGRLLAFDEAVLRGEAARIWIRRPRRGDTDILERIFEERHPRLARDLLDGLAQGWPALPERRQRALVSRLRTFVASPVVALPLLEALVVFNRVEHFGESPPWPLFGAILPVILDQLTEQATGSEPRLFVAVEDAIRHLPPAPIVEICRSWIGWLTRTAKVQLRSDYAWGVISILIDATRTQPELRAGLLEPLFLHVDQSGAASMLIRELVNTWPDLTEPERTLVRGLLSRSRRDQLWLQAVALTHPKPPEDLQRLILGDVLATTASGLEAQLPADFLAACLEVHLGVQPFAYLGLSGRDDEVWAAVADRFAAEPDHPLARLCFEDLIRHELTPRLLAVLPAWSTRLDEVFGLVLAHHMSTSGGPKMKGIWEWLFARASPEQRAAWDQRMASVVVGLIDDLFEIKRDFGLEAEGMPHLWAALTDDYEAMAAAHLLEELEPDATGTIHEGLANMAVRLEAWPPKLFGTYDYVRDRLSRPSNKDDPFWARLKAWRHQVFDVRSPIRDAERMREPEVNRTRWSGPL